MHKRNISLNITIEATDKEMADEAVLREICMKRMHEILGTDCTPPYATKVFEENVTIEPFGDDDEIDELAEDFCITKAYGL